MEEEKVMQNTDNTMSVGEWMITLFISFIPLVNIIMFFVWGFGDNTNPNKANWAKASLIWVAIGIVLYVLFFVVIFAGISMMEGVQVSNTAGV